MLDLGPRQVLSEKVKRELGVQVFNTQGDLDFPGYTWPHQLGGYETVLALHILEHLLNPAMALHDILALATNENTRIYIGLPKRPARLANTEEHYHELPHHAVQKLADRLDLEITHSRHWRKPRRLPAYFRGVRTLTRIFLDRHIIYELRRRRT